MKQNQSIRLYNGEIRYTGPGREIGKLAINLDDTRAIFKNRKNTERLVETLGPVVKKVCAIQEVVLTPRKTGVVVDNAAYLIEKQKPVKPEDALYIYLGEEMKPIKVEVRTETDKGERLEPVKAPSRWGVFLNSLKSSASIRSAWQDAMLHYAFQIEQTIKLLIEDASDA